MGPRFLLREDGRHERVHATAQQIVGL